jgi:hypothetical protein
VLLCLSETAAAVLVTCGGMAGAGVLTPRLTRSSSSTVAIIVVVLFIPIIVIVIHTPGKLI